MGAGDIHAGEGEATEVELVAHFQGHQHVLFHRRGAVRLILGVFLGLNLLHLLLDHLNASAHVLLIKGLGPDGEVGGVERQGSMHLIPGNAEGHHHVGHGVGLGEQVGNLLTGVNVPLGYPMLLHLVLGPLGQTSALSHRLHDLKGPGVLKALGDKEDHNIVTTADGLVNLGSARRDEVLGVAQPHVGAVGEAG